MGRKSVAATVVLAFVVSGAVYLGVRRPGSEGQSDRIESSDREAVQTASAPETRPTLDGTTASRLETAAREIRDASPTFRNSTLLIAIRGAGFYCEDVVAAHESVDGVWVASCADKSGYTLGVRDANEFDVLPIRHYFDAVTPAPAPRDFPPPR